MGPEILQAMLPQAHELSYFLEVAQTLNISRAAIKLGVSQPALSVAIQKLEHNLGVNLFFRSKTGMRLTPEGENFVAKARELNDLWKSCKGQLMHAAHEIQGHFRLGVHVSLALYTLKAFLPNFLKQHPHFHLSLTHDLSRKITEQVIAGKLDLGLAVNPFRHPDLVIKDLLTDEVCFWEIKNNPNPDVLLCDDNLLQTQALLKQTTFSRVVHSSSLEVLLSLAQEGAGVTILPTRIAQLSSKLIRAKKYSKTYKDKICLIYRPEMKNNLAMKTLIREISEALSKI